VKFFEIFPTCFQTSVLQDPMVTCFQKYFYFKIGTCTRNDSFGASLVKHSQNLLELTMLWYNIVNWISLSTKIWCENRLCDTKEGHMKVVCSAFATMNWQFRTHCYSHTLAKTTKVFRNVQKFFYKGVEGVNPYHSLNQRWPRKERNIF